MATLVWFTILGMLHIPLMTLCTYLFFIVRNKPEEDGAGGAMFCGCYMLWMLITALLGGSLVWNGPNQTTPYIVSVVFIAVASAFALIPAIPICFNPPPHKSYEHKKQARSSFFGMLFSAVFIFGVICWWFFGVLFEHL